jgi:hypothetical protein
VILAGAAGALAEMMAGGREPADIGGVDRTDERMLPGTAQHRARDHEHVLSGESLAQLQSFGHRYTC